VKTEPPPVSCDIYTEYNEIALLPTVPTLYPSKPIPTLYPSKPDLKRQEKKVHIVLDNSVISVLMMVRQYNVSQNSKALFPVYSDFRQFFIQQKNFSSFTGLETLKKTSVFLHCSLKYLQH